MALKCGYCLRPIEWDPDPRDAEIARMRARAERAEALLQRACAVLHDEEMDRDFGETPRASTVETRAIFAEVGMDPELCSFGAPIGYSGTPPARTVEEERVREVARRVAVEVCAYVNADFTDQVALIAAEVAAEHFGAAKVTK